PLQSHSLPPTLLLLLRVLLSPCSGDPRDLHSFPTRRSSDLHQRPAGRSVRGLVAGSALVGRSASGVHCRLHRRCCGVFPVAGQGDRKSTRLNSSHVKISYAVFCLKKKTT